MVQVVVRIFYGTAILWTAAILCSNTPSRGVRRLGELSSAAEIAEDERIADFEEWVRRVGEKSHPTEKDPKFAIAESSSRVVIVDRSSGGAYSTIQEAIDNVPEDNQQRVVIRLRAGVFEEKVKVPDSKPFITLEGAGADSTTITWGDTAETTGSLANSATISVDAMGFIARDLTIQNSAPVPSPGAENQQAVALRISGDQAAFYECKIIGAQDTLFDDQGRHYFENCFIQGSVDFICGNGQSLYKGCRLNAIGAGGVITAQKRMSPEENTGFSFVECCVTGSGMAYLGRAWGPYARVVFSYSCLGQTVQPKGWFDWGIPSRDKTVFFGQYRCRGAGAIDNGRVSWAYDLTDEQAAPFQSLDFIDGESWLPT